MSLKLQAKHQAAEITIFSQMSALALKHNAVNLSQGFPDFDLDPLLANLLNEAAQKGYNQYAPMPGLPLLRQAIAQDFENRYQLQIDEANEITICPGASYAIYTSLATILSAGDEVIVLEPAYDCYMPAIQMLGATAKTVKLNPSTFLPDWPTIQKEINSKTKAIIINTPHNPTGVIWSESDFKELERLVQAFDLFVISDEVYEQLVFDSKKHISVLQYPILKQRSFAVFSFGKAFHNTGWKVGYCIAPPGLTAAFRRLHQYIAFSVNTPAQFALARYLIYEGRASASKMLQTKRDFFIEQMKKTRFTMLAPSAGSYFQLVSYQGLSSLPDNEFAQLLTTEYGVASIPVSAFYKDGFDNRILRFCFAKKEETLTAAIEKLKKVT